MSFTTVAYVMVIPRTRIQLEISKPGHKGM